jgi:hypothetical protein
VTFGEETEDVLTEVFGGLGIGLATSFRIVDPEVSTPNTGHWEATRRYWSSRSANCSVGALPLRGTSHPPRPAGMRPAGGGNVGETVTAAMAVQPFHSTVMGFGWRFRLVPGRWM